MVTQDKQPDLFQAHARRSDPETSHEAAASVTQITQKQSAVFRCFENRALTDEELIAEYARRHGFAPGLYPEQSESGLRTRRSELVGRGLVRFSGEYGKTESGRRSRKWKWSVR